jgi:hypothetical protein
MFGLMLALALTQLGGMCDPTPGADPGAAPATFLCTPTNVYEGPGETFDIAVKFDTTANVQAVELDIEWDPASVKYLSSSPHPDFDDDGQFFTPAILDEVDGSLRGIRDARHGVSTVSGRKGVIALQFRVETSTPSTIVATGRVANEQGVQSESLVATCYISAGQI